MRIFTLTNVFHRLTLPRRSEVMNFFPSSGHRWNNNGQWLISRLLNAAEEGPRINLQPFHSDGFGCPSLPVPSTASVVQRHLCKQNDAVATIKKVSMCHHIFLIAQAKGCTLIPVARACSKVREEENSCMMEMARSEVV